MTTPRKLHAFVQGIANLRTLTERIGQDIEEAEVEMAHLLDDLIRQARRLLYKPPPRE